MLYHRAISAPLSVWTVLKSEIQSAITKKPEPLPPIAIDEPTMSMLFTINDSPFFGKEGKFVTSRHIHDRLMKELDKNLALRVAKANWKTVNG
mgnify:FL=1